MLRTVTAVMAFRMARRRMVILCKVTDEMVWHSLRRTFWCSLWNTASGAICTRGVGRVSNGTSWGRRCSSEHDALLLSQLLRDLVELIKQITLLEKQSQVHDATAVNVHLTETADINQTSIASNTTVTAGESTPVTPRKMTEIGSSYLVASSRNHSFSLMRCSLSPRKIHLELYACHPCAGTMLIFSVLFNWYAFSVDSFKATYNYAFIPTSLTVTLSKDLSVQAPEVVAATIKRKPGPPSKHKRKIARFGSAAIPTVAMS